MTMQTAPIPSVAPAGPSGGSGNAVLNAANAAQPNSFDQVLTREVAQRQPEAPRPAAARDKPAAERSEQNKPAADSAPAAEATDESEEAPDPAALANAGQVSSDMLALVAQISELRPGQAAAQTDPDADAQQAALNPSLLKSKGGRSSALPAAGAPLQNADASGRGGNAQAAPTTTARSGPASGEVLQSPLATGTATTSVGKSGADPAEFSALLKEGTTPLANAQALSNTASEALAAAAKLGDRLAPRVGGPNWDQALGQRIVWMVQGEQQTASLTLNPPELGPLKVVLQLTSTQANASFVAAQPEVRQALESAMPRLRDMLSEAGIQLGQATVDSGQTQQQNQESGQGRRAPAGADAHGNGIAETGALPPRAQAAGQGLVDTFA